MIDPNNNQRPGNHFLQRVIQSGTRFVQTERESKIRFSDQSERSTFGRGSFGLQSKIGLAINGKGNVTFDRKIRM